MFARLGIKVVGIVALILVVFGVGALSASGSGSIFSIAGLSSDKTTTRTEVIQAVKREEQIVLLALGIQGINKEDGDSKFFGMSLPGTERIAYMQYGFDAKLGIEGKDVQIDQTGENKYLVRIPQFIFIGHNNEKFELIAEDNGILSWITEDTDIAAAITKILNSDVKDEYIAKNQDLLRDQAESFYRGIINSVEPEAEVLFKY